MSSPQVYIQRQVEKKKTFCVAFFLFPLGLIVLGNFYKGVNISRLTLGPTLIPFDTIDSLVQHNFTIMSRRLPSSKYLVNMIKKYTVNEEFEQTRHENFPVLSEFGREILYRWPTGKWKNMKRSKLLVHSQMFPDWLDKNKSPYALWDAGSINQECMMYCNKLAVVLPEVDAIGVHTILKTVSLPVYFGKDVLSKNLNGYRLFGTFSSKVIWN